MAEKTEFRNTAMVVKWHCNADRTEVSTIRRRLRATKLAEVFGSKIGES